MCSRPLSIAVMACASCLLAGVGQAQTDAGRDGPPATPEARPTPDGCGARAALYAGDTGTKIWVLRRGSMVLAENPLRPLSRDQAVVLQVVVKGRVATAYGPDPDNLRQGGAPSDVERLGAEPIRWTDDGTPRPVSLRVVADDGTVLLGPLRFVECADAPNAKPVAATARRPEKPIPVERRTGGARAAGLPGSSANTRSIPSLPQGALPNLDLPPPTPR